MPILTNRSLAMEEPIVLLLHKLRPMSENKLLTKFGNGRFGKTLEAEKQSRDVKSWTTRIVVSTIIDWRRDGLQCESSSRTSLWSLSLVSLSIHDLCHYLNR